MPFNYFFPLFLHFGIVWQQQSGMETTNLLYTHFLYNRLERLIMAFDIGFE